MVPVRKGDHSGFCLPSTSGGSVERMITIRPTIVDIIEVLERIMGVVDDERPPQSITVLGGKVAVVPECTCGKRGPVGTERHGKLHKRSRTSLVASGEVVQERVPRRDRALIHKGRAICPVRALLEEAVPVLSGPRSHVSFHLSR